MMKISIIIPNYNGRSLLEKNLPVILKVSQGAEIIIIDDASTDDSVNFIKAAYPNIKVIVHHMNKGFATSVNDGVAEASGELVYLLNSDVMPEENFLVSLVPHFTDPSVFAVGSLQKSSKRKGAPYHGRGTGKFERGFLIHAAGKPDKHDTLWVFGGAGMFRKNTWQELGGLDTLYDPFYWEDIDLSYRAKKCGYKTLFEPKSTVLHLQEEGAIRTSHKPQYVNSVAFRNQILFVWLNITDEKYFLNHFFYLPWHFLKSLFRLDSAFIFGLFRAVLLLPMALNHRNRNKKLFKKSDKEILGEFTD